MDDKTRNEKQLLYYHKFKKQLKYYYDNKEKRLAYMKEYRKKHKINKQDVLKVEKLLKFEIKFGIYIIDFD